MPYRLSDDNRGWTLRPYDLLVRGLAFLVLLSILALIAWYAVVMAPHLNTVSFIYTELAAGYLLSRFALAAMYRTPKDVGIQPTVAVIVPAFNEGPAIARTIHACMAFDYPRSRRQVIVVNDGSSDDTWDHMMHAASQHPPGAVRLMNLPSTQGYWSAMATGIRATTADIVVFLDTDSLPDRDGVRRLVQVFIDPKVGAVSGLVIARNSRTNALTRMQQAWYYVSFQLLRTAESVAGAVTCNSRCFSAYRRAAVLPILKRLEHQRFLFEGDRALTNLILRQGWVTVQHSGAIVWTDVPERYRSFFRQQLRWKKSWLRETPILLSHIWRTRPLAAPVVLSQVLVGLLSPIVILYNLLLPSRPAGLTPILYAIALVAVACSYGMLYRIQRNDGLWKWAIFGTFFYAVVSIQFLWAAVRYWDRARPYRKLSASAAKIETPADVAVLQGELALDEKRTRGNEYARRLAV